MRTRLQLTLLAAVAWMLASAPAIAASDSTIYISVDDGIPATTYTLASFVQTDDKSFNVVMPLNAASLTLLAVTTQRLIVERLVFVGHITSQVGQTTTRYGLTGCVMKSASSGSDGNAHFAFICQKVDISLVHVLAATPMPVLKSDVAHPQPLPAPTATK